MTRKNLKIYEDTHAELSEGKADDETWDEYLLRLRQLERATEVSEADR